MIAHFLFQGDCKTRTHNYNMRTREKTYEKHIGKFFTFPNLTGPVALSNFDEIETETKCNITIYNVDEISLFDNEGESNSDSFKINLLRQGNNPNVCKNLS